MNQYQRTLKAMRFATVLAAISQLSAAAAAAPPGETPNPQDPPSANPAPDVPVPASAQSPRDQAVPQRLVLSRIDGEICWIESEGKNFLALFRESHEALLHGGLARLDHRPRAASRTFPLAGQQKNSANTREIYRMFL